MSGRPTRTTTEDRGFGKYLEQAAIERTGHPKDEGSEETTETRPAEQQDTSRPPVTGRRGQRGTGFGRYLA